MSVIKARILAAFGQPEARLTLAEQLGTRGDAIAAVRQIAAAAHDGLPEAQARLGLCYLRGHGVPSSQTEARHWLELAAAAGDATAQTELAGMALRGFDLASRGSVFGVAGDGVSDPALAASFARTAAEAGSAEAQGLLAYILRMHPDMPGDPEALYRASAEGGWPLGQLGHAMTLIARGEVAVAVGLLRGAAEGGLPTAHFLLGAIAEAEGGLADAAAHYAAGAAAGHTGAKTRLGMALLSGRGVVENKEDAQAWLRRAARDGDAVAACLLGDYRAIQVRDLPDAAHWYRHAAELGHGGAARALARALMAGAEGAPDPRDIAAWLRTAIEHGEPGAWVDLGAVIAARALPADALPDLHDWLQRMVREGHSEAAYYTGLCINGGIGTPVDEALARRYYLRAAGEGVIDAMAAAAEMLANGRGGPPDADLARRLFVYAAARDHAGASYALGILAGDDRDGAAAHFRRAASLGHAKAALAA